MLKKILMLSFCFFIFSFIFINISASEDVNIDVFDNENLIFQLNGVGFDINDISIKHAKDFAGNGYIVGEASEGYFIYSEDVNSLLEYSLNAPSPFSNYYKDIIYAGPGEYFVKEGLDYLSLLEGKVYESSKVFYESAVANKEIEIFKEYGVASYASMPVDYKWSVNHPEFFNRDCNYYCGYFDGGYCGFIGLGLLVGYTDKYKNNSLMDDKFYQDSTTKTGLKNDNDSISKFLYDSNPKESTTSKHIKTVMKDYAKSKNISISYTSRWTPFFTSNTISSALENDTPVELFGTFKYDNEGSTESTGNHAIVAYAMGYIPHMDSASFGYKCHLGWRGYGEVVITSHTIGSIYFFNCK